MCRLKQREVHLALFVFSKTSPSSAPVLRAELNAIKYHIKTTVTRRNAILLAENSRNKITFSTTDLF